MKGEYFLGLDLGQSQDFTAIAILEKGDETYKVRHLERPNLGTPYPKIIERVSHMMMSDQLVDKTTLVLDQTGCGRPVFDLFKKAGLKPVGILIHGGDTATRDGRNWRVPKRDLVATLQVLLQNGRLKVSRKLELEPVLSSEMLNFKVKIDPATSHDSYSSWREGDHDDLVLAVALAAWYGENGPKTIKYDARFIAIDRSKRYSERWII
jgi:hypothetical protein